MSSRLDLISLLTSLSLCFVSVTLAKIKVKHGPSGMSFNDTTSCVEFAKFARFNPYSVLEEKWFVFYYWAPPQSHQIYLFTFPSANHTRHLHKLLDKKTIIPVDWSARQILMEDQHNETSLLVERGDRGEYWLYPLHGTTRGIKIRPKDIRLKQTGDNRLLGLMDCDKENLFVMSRIDDVPPKNKLQDEAARMGFRSRRGKSYLYQGHEWMPIPEDDEEHYWERPKRSKGSEKSSNEVDSSNQSGEQLELQPNNMPRELEAVSKGEEHLSINEQMTSPSTNVKVKRESRNDHVNLESGNSQLTKEQLDSQETNVIEPIQPNDDPDSSNEPVNDLTTESEKTQMTNERGKRQEENDSVKGQTTYSPKNLGAITNTEQKEPQSTKEPDLQSGSNKVDTKSSYDLVDPQTESTEGSNNSKNLQLTSEPVSPQGTDESVSPHSYDEPISSKSSYRQHDSETTYKPDNLPNNH